MKILFVGAVDWANLCHRIARGINATGRATARVWVANSHPFGYQEDWVGQENEEAEAFASEADWIVTTGDGYAVSYAVAEQAAALGKAKIAVTHAGSAFRADPFGLLELDKGIGARARFVGFDSLHLTSRGGVSDGIPTHPYWSTCEPVIPVTPMMPGARIHVAHSPSARSKKGTDEIIKAVERARVELGSFDFDLIEGVSFNVAIDRRSSCHVFVDQLVPEIGGFGCSAVEAMAQGCAVIADVRHVPIGNVTPPILHAEDGEALFRLLRRFWGNPDELQSQRVLSVAWAIQHALPAAVGHRWLSILENCS
jgi:hypothetical protein